MAKVLGQSVPLKIMSGIYKSGRLHHAYLFYGEEGIGKFESALNYAKEKTELIVTNANPVK